MQLKVRVPLTAGGTREVVATALTSRAALDALLAEVVPARRETVRATLIQFGAGGADAASQGDQSQNHFLEHSHRDGSGQAAETGHSHRDAHRPPSRDQGDSTHEGRVSSEAVKP